MCSCADEVVGVELMWSLALVVKCVVVAVETDCSLVSLLMRRRHFVESVSYLAQLGTALSRKWTVDDLEVTTSVRFVAEQPWERWRAERKLVSGPSSGRRALRSAGTNRLVVLPVRLTTVGSRAFPVAAAQIWNSLPEHIVSAPTLQSFRHHSKMVLLQQTFCL